MSNRFTAIPEVPIGITDAQTLLISAVKENVELLTGFRNEDDSNSKSITKGDITVREGQIQKMRQISAKGKGFTFDPVSADAYVNLLQSNLSLNDEQITNALKFSYWFYFVCCVHFDSLKFASGFPPFSNKTSLLRKENLTGARIFLERAGLKF